MLNDYAPADFRTLSVIYTILVIAASFTQVPPGPPTFNIDKILHMSLYYGFAFVLWRGFSDKKFLGAAFFLGVLLEFIQPTFGREFDLLDMAANGLGILIFYYFSKQKNL